MKPLLIIVSILGILVLSGCQEKNDIDNSCRTNGGIVFGNSCHEVWEISINEVNITYKNKIYEENYARLDGNIINCRNYSDECYHFVSYDAIVEYRGTQIKCFLIDDTYYNIPSFNDKFRSMRIKEGCFKNEVYNNGHGGFCQGGFIKCELHI